LRLPAQSAAPETIYVRIADWDGRPLSGLRIQLVATEEESGRSQQQSPHSPGGGE
jgi:hypothetical protein